ncbi:MAG: hypothetical protein ACK4K7_02995 [Allosphingosinicella sp.]|uniref:hypothetical protein n=1 Tax=Allosphingosinicella sp. TaxID=2823234 RepID=UPI00396287F5
MSRRRSRRTNIPTRALIVGGIIVAAFAMYALVGLRPTAVHKIQAIEVVEATDDPDLSDTRFEEDRRIACGQRYTGDEQAQQACRRIATASFREFREAWNTFASDRQVRLGLLSCIRRHTSSYARGATNLSAVNWANANMCAQSLVSAG